MYIAAMGVMEVIIAGKMQEDNTEPSAEKTETKKISAEELIKESSDIDKEPTKRKFSFNRITIISVILIIILIIIAGVSFRDRPDDTMTVPEYDLDFETPIYNDVIRNNCKAWVFDNISYCRSEINISHFVTMGDELEAREEECIIAYIDAKNSVNKNTDACQLLEDQTSRDECIRKAKIIIEYQDKGIDEITRICNSSSEGNGYWECMAMITRNQNYCHNILDSDIDDVMKKYKTSRCVIFSSPPEGSRC